MSSRGRWCVFSHVVLTPSAPTHTLPGTFWATSVAGVLAYEWSKPIPASLKVIHARVIAQGACLAGLAALAAVEAYEARAKLDTVQARLESVEKRVK